MDLMGRRRGEKNEPVPVAAERQSLADGFHRLGLPPEVVEAVLSLPPREIVKVKNQLRDFMKIYGGLLDVLFGTAKRKPKEE